MNWVYFGIQPKTILLSPITADTLWGHLCWFIRETEGESTLAEFIKSFETAPPFLLSDAFPFKQVPMPLIPLEHKYEPEIIQQKLPETLEEKRKTLPLLNRLKKLKKTRFVSYEIISTMMADFNALKLLKEFFLAAEKEEPVPHQEIIEPHVTIDRQTLGAREGQLFFTAGTAYSPSATPAFWILALIRNYDPELLFKQLQQIGNLGYGADRSVGKGSFDVTPPQPLQPQPITDANIGVALSHFVPAENDSTRGCWNLSTKFGKVGGLYSVGSPAPEIPFTPFKKPLIMLIPGSVFLLTHNFTDKPYWGRIVHNVHRLPRVVHYGYAPILPLKATSDVLNLFEKG